MNKFSSRQVVILLSFLLTIVAGIGWSLLSVYSVEKYWIMAIGSSRFFCGKLLSYSICFKSFYSGKNIDLFTRLLTSFQKKGKRQK